MRHKVGVASGLTSLVLVLSAVFAPLANAYSGYGSGTSASPYRISSCAQLESINSNLSAYYVLVSNINCTGVSFATMGIFTGTLDGQDHTVKNLTITGPSQGLFSQATNATIKNLNLLNGSMTDGSDAGSVVGWATNSTFTNIHSNITITASGGNSWTGGLIGLMSGSTLTDSSYTGSVGGAFDTGGLVGVMMSGTASTISNSFFSGTLTANGSDAGGLVGEAASGTLVYSYSSGTINMNGQSVVGGLVGLADGAYTAESFSSSTMVGTPGSNGAVFGTFDTPSTRYQNYFDQYLANDLNTNSNLPCAGVDQGASNCNPENANNAAPTYFTNNNTNNPLSTWDFTHTWATSASYPTFLNWSSFNAPNGIPNSGDANGDGTLDSYQANVADIEDTGSIWSTVQVPSATLCTLGSAASTATTSLGADTGYAAESNLDAFDIYCPTAGSTVAVTIIYDKVYTSPTLRYYNPTSQTWSTVPGAVFSTVTVGGVTKTEVTYSITDGGLLDEDGVANGVIVDPVDLATAVIATPAAPNTGFGVSLSRPLVTLAEYSLIAAGLATGAIVMQRRMSNKSK